LAQRRDARRGRWPFIAAAMLVLELIFLLPALVLLLVVAGPP
jgi:hypothetical protein